MAIRRDRIGLQDYFLPPAKIFVAGDWTPSAGLTVTVDGPTGYLRLAPGTTNPCRRSAMLNTVGPASGGYVWSNSSRGTANLGIADIFTSLADQTGGSEDAQGARFTMSGGGFPSGDLKESGNSEWVAGVETSFGAVEVNLASGSVNHLFAWVEPGAVAPACLAKRYTAATTVTTDFPHGGPMSRELIGRPGLGVGSSGSNVFLQVYEFWALLDRYVWVRGLRAGQKANVLTSGDAKRFPDAVADSTGLAKIDTWGDLTPLLSYKLSIFASNGTTLVDEIQPIDGGGLVWGGDDYLRPVTVFPYGAIRHGCGAGN